MLRSILLASLLLSISLCAFAQNGYFNLNGHKVRYRGARVGALGNYRLTLAAQYNAAKEAGKDMNALLRDELAVGIVIAPATLRVHYREYTERGIPSDDDVAFDTTYSVENAQSAGYVISELTGYPLSTFNENSALLFTYGISARFLHFKPEPVKLNGVEREFGVATMDLSAPLSLVYKSGAEAMLDRAKGSCFTIGVGFEPMLMMATYGTIVGYNKLMLLPLVKVEFGASTRIGVFKLRATASPGRFTYFDVEGIHDQYSS
jgi:hypothetical protein